MYNLNDNVFRNLHNMTISPRTYDPSFKCKYWNEFLTQS